MPIVAALCLLVFVGSPQAAQPKAIGLGCNKPVSAQVGVAHAVEVWDPSRWKRLDGPKAKAVKTHRRNVRCAKGPRHRAAIRDRWRAKRAQFKRHQRRQLERHNINHRWTAHWAPDYSGPTLPMYVLAALAEKAGDALEVDVPGWTMAQMTIGESGSRPGSAGVDPGGASAGYGLWAITTPFSDDIVAPLGGYAEMLNPVNNAAAMTAIYARQGLGAWYGDSYVTSTSAHYEGRFDLRLVLGGLSFREAIRVD